MSNAKRQADALIQSGFDSQRAGDLAQAQADFEEALTCCAEHPAALQLLGLLARRRGDAVQAEALMRRSLASDARQPHVWNNLGNLLDHSSRWPEALVCFERALDLSSTYADAHYNQARVLCSLGRQAEALTALVRAQTLSPVRTTAMRQLHSRILESQGDLQSAVTVLDEALRLSPDGNALWHNRATLLQRLHRPVEALQSHERALAMGLDVADAHYNHGNTLQTVGRLDDAVAAYRRALARQPLHELALYDLARLRWRQGDPAFDEHLLLAARQHPQSPHPHAIRAQLLWRAERYAEAAQAFRKALIAAPQTAGFHDGLGRCLVRMGERTAGLAAQQLAAQLAPNDASVRANLAASLLLASRVDDAEREAAAACELAPHDQYAWALRGLAWRLLGDAREEELNNVEGLVKVVDIEAPDGHADMPSFNEALAEELLRLHRDSEAPIDQTLRCGTQTLGDIFEQGHALVDALKVRISQAVDDFVRGLPRDDTHPFLRRRSGHWRFADSWSSRLRDEGFHTNHVHPHGWISSAYYVQVPTVCADTARREGWLRFGLPDFDLGVALLPRLEIQPRPGRLVLFPSMLWHGTAPFHAPERRLTLAFDVVPR